MSIGVEARGGSHERHLRRGSPGGVKLVGWLSSTAFEGWVDIWGIPVDVTTVDETADQCNSTITKSLCGGIPPLLLHGENGRVIEPLALGTVHVVGAGTRIEDTDGLGPVIIFVGRIICT
jgi:hypothetical protein